MRQRKQQQGVRIIGGQWRGRQLPVADAEGLRPTKDMVRETLFNWLQAVIEGSRCLDAFAGSGALGFEAASRGAAKVVLLETSALLCRQLQQQAEQLKAEQVRVVNGAAEVFLAKTGEVQDIVFLDPPFHSGLLAKVCDLLQMNGWVGSGTQIYIETGRADGWPDLPQAWQWRRQKFSGEVAYGLAEVV